MIRLTNGLRAAFLVATSAASLGQEPAFPPSTALAEGLSPDALAKLDGLVRGLADSGEVVGAELLVVVGGKTIHHEGYGLSDQEAGTPMETGRVFCVRSMTKPVVGAAILMLAGERKLRLSDPVSEYLPALDVERWREVTIEHLLSHTTGLPFSLIAGRELSSLESIQEVAALGAGYELEFEPGSAFQYSDQGTDTLTAVIEVASGMPAADFVRTRILEPLGMEHSACVMTEDHPLRARALPKYFRSGTEWKRFWGPDEPPLFPFFLGSQGLYATLEDYAKFMQLWLKKGRGPEGRLLKALLARKALTPNGLPFPAGSGFSGLEGGYGFLMQLWTRAGEGEAAEPELVAFGHNGSDGTHAWVFPEHEALVMYFTQSRNTTTGLLVEEALGELFLGAPFDPNVAAPPLEPYLGYYQEDEPDLYRAIVRDGDGLALEVRGKALLALAYMGEDRWKVRDNPGLVLEFDRSPEGTVTGFRLAGNQEYRFEPAADLPSADELAERVAAAHRMDLVEELGPIRMRGTIRIDKLDLTGELTSLLAWPDRFRVDARLGAELESAAFDGQDVRAATRFSPVSVLTGERADMTRIDNAFARFGDLRRWHPTMRVIERDVRDGEEIFLLRTGDTSGPATTIYVHGETGRVLMVDSLTYADGMGRIGQRMKLEDWREVSGMMLPHRMVLELPNPIVGTIVTTIEEEVELGVEVAEGTFELRDRVEGESGPDEVDDAR